MANIAVVTGSRNPHPAVEDQLLIGALRDLGATVQHAAWNDESIDWSSFDSAIIRSTWDYTVDVDGFLSWVERAGRATRLLNPADVIAWNADKHHLRELTGKGIPVVPTSYIEAGQPWEPPDLDEYVIKPVYSGGGRNSGRFRRGRDDASARALAESVLQPGCELMGTSLDKGRSLIIQPYMPIDEVGETGIVVLDGNISHAILKQAVLIDGGGTTTRPGTRGNIVAGSWDDEQASVAEQVMQHIPGGHERCPYMRIDVVRDDEGHVRLMELELIEPQLFFAEAPGSANRLAKVLLANL
jgi:glutathione synthase/RimK-type ligase-like ATP-grasp enzyme